MDTEDGRWVEVAREIIWVLYDYQLVNYSFFLLLPPRLCSCVCWIYFPSWRKPYTGREMGPDPPHTVTRSCSWSWRTWSPSTAFSYAGLTREPCQLLWRGESLSSWIWPHSSASLCIASFLLSLGWGSWLSGTWKGWSESSLVTWRCMMDPRRRPDCRYWKPWKFSCSMLGPGMTACTQVRWGARLHPCSLQDLPRCVRSRVLRTSCTDTTGTWLWKWHWQDIDSVPSGGSSICKAC